MKKFYSEKTVVPLFFGIWFVLVFVFWVKDYGLPYDELTQRGTGGVSAKYLVSLVSPGYVESNPAIKALPDLETYKDRAYGVGFELPLVIAEKIMGFSEEEPGFVWFRHRVKFLIFFIATLSLYFLTRKWFKSWQWALLACAMLILNPRTFGDSIYNSKDGVFLSACLLSTWAMFHFLEKITWQRALLFSFIAAWATCVRILGILFPVAAGGILILRMVFQSEEKGQQKKNVLNLILLGGSFCLFTMAMWPYLWKNPLLQFLEAMKISSSFSGFQGSVELWGKSWYTGDLPWFYLPAYIFLTVPLFYLVAFVTGLFFILKNLFPIKNLLTQKENPHFFMLVLAGFIFAPVALVILKKSVMYNGWRHFYFIWGWMVLVGIYGLKQATDFLNGLKFKLLKKSGPYLVPGILIAQLSWSGILIAKNHPYECVYFNVAAGSAQYAEKNFDLDYWGISYPETLNWLAKNVNADSIHVNVASYPGITNRIMVPHPFREKLKYTEKKFSEGIPEAEYLVGYLAEEPALPEVEELYSVKAFGMTISRVLRKKISSGPPQMP